MVDRVFDFAEAHEAYRYFLRGGGFGKVVVTPDRDGSVD